MRREYANIYHIPTIPPLHDQAAKALLATFPESFDFVGVAPYPSTFTFKADGTVDELAQEYAGMEFAFQRGDAAIYLLVSSEAMDQREGNVETWSGLLRTIDQRFEEHARHDEAPPCTA